MLHTAVNPKSHAFIQVDLWTILCCTACGLCRKVLILYGLQEGRPFLKAGVMTVKAVAAFAQLQVGTRVPVNMNGIVVVEHRERGSPEDKSQDSIYT